MGVDFQRLADLFERARQITAQDARDAFLADACDGDAALREELEELLVLHDGNGADRPAPRIVPGASADLTEVWEASRGETFSPLVPGYEVGACIGTGGMGAVYEARQIDPPRQVALKLLRPEMASEEGRGRFQREVKALARLQHPGIAQILAAGECTTPAGASPYLVLEYIGGGPITGHARALDRRECVKLVIDVCAAVSHAHRRGIIHRDIKPSNILVSEEGAPKVLDFGLAVAADAADTELPRQTKTGHFVGTLGYMSPEQATGRFDAVDTRTDVYSVGVLAYEMLTGRLPHPVDGLPLEEALRRLRTGKPDPAPELPVDLQVILGKALRHDREDRYESAAAFSEDLRRYLVHEPIAARPPSAMYRMRKFVRRHRVPVAAAAFTIVALVVGLVLAWRAADLEQAARRRADAQTAVANAAASHAHLMAARSDHRGGHLTSMAKNLAAVRPEDRHWEWHYLHAQVDQSIESAPLPEGFDVEVWPVRPPPDAEWAARRRLLQGHGVWFSPIEGESPARLQVPGGPTDGVAITGVSGRVRTIRTSLDATRIVVHELRPTSGATHIHIYGHQGGEPLLSTPWDCGSPKPVCHPLRAEVLAAKNDGIIAVERGGPDPEMRFLQAHPQQVTALAWTRDGARFATAAGDRRIRVWDAKTHEMLFELDGKATVNHALAFSHDGAAFASGGGDGVVRVWDVATRTLRRALGGHSGPVTHLAFEPSGSELQSIASDGWRRWSLTVPGASVYRFHQEQEDGARFPYIYAVAFSPDGRSLASGGWDKTIRIVDLASGRLTRTIDADRVLRLSYDAQGVLYSKQWSVKAWDPATGELIAEHGAYDAPFCVQPRGPHLVVLHSDLEGLLVLSRPRLEVVAHWTDARPDVFDMAFSPDGGRVATIGSGGVLTVHSFPSGEVAWQVNAHEVPCNALAFDPSGSRVVTADVRGRVRLWDLRAKKMLREWTAGNSAVHALAFHPDGSRVASAGADGSVRIWAPDTGLEQLRLDGHRSYVKDVAFSPDGFSLASASGDNSVRVWSARSERYRYAAARGD